MRAFQGAAGWLPKTASSGPIHGVPGTSPGLDARFFDFLFRSSWFVGEMTARLRGIGSSEQGNVRTPRITPRTSGRSSLSFRASRAASHRRAPRRRDEAKRRAYSEEKADDRATWWTHIMRRLRRAVSVACTVPSRNHRRAATDDFWWSLEPPRAWTVARLVDVVDPTSGSRRSGDFSNTEGFPLTRITRPSCRRDGYVRYGTRAEDAIVATAIWLSGWMATSTLLSGMEDDRP